MYSKNLTEDLRLRLSKKDMDFLRGLSEERATSVSECIRSIIGEYRRSLDAMNMIQNLVDLSSKEGLSDGDTKTYFDNKL